MRSLGQIIVRVRVSQAEGQREVRTSLAVCAQALARTRPRARRASIRDARVGGLRRRDGLAAARRGLGLRDGRGRGAHGATSSSAGAAARWKGAPDHNGLGGGAEPSCSNRSRGPRACGRLATLGEEELSSRQLARLLGIALGAERSRPPRAARPGPLPGSPRPWPRSTARRPFSRSGQPQYLTAYVNPGGASRDGDGWAPVLLAARRES